MKMRKPDQDSRHRQRTNGPGDGACVADGDRTKGRGENPDREVGAVIPMTVPRGSSGLMTTLPMIPGVRVTELAE